MDKHRSKSTLPVIIVLAVIGSLIYWFFQPQPPAIKMVTEPSSSPEIVLTGQSSDGDIALTLTQQPATGAITWILAAAKTTETAKTIWWLTLPADAQISIPLNAVSPDNKYLFLKQKQPGKTGYLALTVNGTPLTKDSQAVDFGELFAQKYPDYQITEVTGWGGLNLIVFNTDIVAGGGTGPSFWFDIASQSFIQLSSRFN
jgi:hypothetical protein